VTFEPAVYEWNDKGLKARRLMSLVQLGAEVFVNAKAMKTAPLNPDAPLGWVNIAVEGTWKGHAKGPVTFSAEVFDQMIANFGKRTTPIKFDYEHQSLDKSLPAGPRPSAGHVHDLEKRDGERGVELWALVEWTDRAAALVREHAYNFCSPVFHMDSIDRVTDKPHGAELFQVGLTDDPFLDGLHPIQLTRLAAMTAEEQKKADDEKAAMAAADADKKDAVPCADDAVKADGDKPKDEEPKAAAAENAVDDGSSADMNALLEMLAEAAGGDKAATLAALMDSADQLVEIIQKKLAKDGTPAEARTPMSATEGTKTVPVKIAADDVAARAELRQLRADNKTMLSRLESLEKKNQSDAAAAIADKVDEKIAGGYIDLGDNADEARKDAIWMFTTDPARAERLYSKQNVPVGKAKRSADGKPTNDATPLTVEQQVSALSNDQQAVYLALSTFRTPQEALKATLARTASS